jgi:hypothetical protein
MQCLIEREAERLFFHPADEDLSAGAPVLTEKPRPASLVKIQLWEIRFNLSPWFIGHSSMALPSSA